MKLNKLLVLVSLVGLGATSCTPRSRSVSGICGGTSTTNSSTATGGDTNTSTGLGFDTTDPYTGVLEGLDTNKAAVDYSKTVLYKGYATDDNDKVCYGWEDYTVESWGGAKYGVAVKLTFDDNGKIEDVVIGAPGEGYSNFSSSYADSTGKKIYLTKYLASERANVLAVIKGKTAYELIKAFNGLKCDDSGSEGMTKWKVSEDETYDFMGTGATQTDTRLQIAIKNACLAFVNTETGYNAYDPLYNGGNYLLTDDTLAEQAKALSETAESADADTAVSGHCVKVDETTYVGFAAYSVPAWWSFYGAGVEIKVDSSKKITGVKLGYPYRVSGTWHNFTPSYIKTNPAAYYAYVTETTKNVESFLINKTVDSTLLSKVSSATLSIRNGEGGGQSIDNATKFVTEAGASQTNARLNLAIAGALTEILK